VWVEAETISLWFINYASSSKKNGKLKYFVPLSSLIGIKHIRHSPTKIEVPSDQTSPLQVSRKTRLEALAYRINDWVDESVVAPKPISSTPEKNPRGTSTPSKIRDTTTLKSAASVKSVVGSHNYLFF
jgi:hypothetical protein